MGFIPQLLPSTLAFPFSCMKHVQINEMDCLVMRRSPASALCSHGSPTSPAAFSSDNYFFPLVIWLQVWLFFPLLNKELHTGSNNWCSVFFPYPLKTLLFKTTEYICHLEMKLWKYLQCFICLFDFVCISLCILSISFYASTFHLHL